MPALMQNRTGGTDAVLMLGKEGGREYSRTYLTAWFHFIIVEVNYVGALLPLILQLLR